MARNAFHPASEAQFCGCKRAAPCESRQTGINLSLCRLRCLHVFLANLLLDGARLIN